MTDMIIWTESPDKPVNNALMDYIDAAILLAESRRSNQISAEEFESAKAQLRREMNARLESL